MALLGNHHHTIERRHHALELDPRFATPARRVKTGGVLGDEPFVAVLQRLFECRFDFTGVPGGMDGDGFEREGERERFEFCASV